MAQITSKHEAHILDALHGMELPRNFDCSAMPCIQHVCFEVFEPVTEFQFGLLRCLDRLGKITCQLSHVA